MTAWLAARAGLLATILSCVSFTASAYCEQVTLSGPVVKFPAGSLGGIRVILQYSVARPDRTEKAIIFLGAPREAGMLPEEIPVVGATGEQQRSANVEGADCTLQRVAVIHLGPGVFVAVATRVFDMATLGEGLAAPAPMDIQLYRLQPGGLTAEASLVLRADGASSRTRPLCTSVDVQRAVGAIANPAPTQTGKRQ